LPKNKPTQKQLVCTSATLTCVNVYGCYWNTCKVVFTVTCTQVPRLVLVSMWVQPYFILDWSPKSNFWKLLEQEFLQTYPTKHCQST